MQGPEIIVRENVWSKAKKT